MNLVAGEDRGQIVVGQGEEDGGNKRVAVVSMSERDKAAVQGARPRKGVRKFRGTRDNHASKSNSNSTDPIQSVSDNSEGALSSRIPNDSILISALRVCLVQGQPLPNYNEETVAYRLEAERLFNIGINLGVSSNEDKRLMIERLIDMEKNDVLPAEVLEE
ncbi:hypothetical protein A2U01_0012064, partial [Trifolium medium]|nr:hypothetical protein [Trifolium medium]